MENAGFAMPGYRIWEYLLVLDPGQDLAQRIHKIREEFAGKYKSGLVTTLRPHIALVHFQTWEMMEEKILQRLKSISLGLTPFRCEIKDYGNQPSHTIHLNVTSRTQVKQIIDSLKEASRLMKLSNDHKPHFMEDPQIPIARRLKPWQFEEGWREYSHRHFTGKFIADGMLLLKRAAGSKSRYQIVQRFEFKDLPVLTKQGSLFAE